MHECTNAHTDCECKRLMCDACFEDAATKELRAGGWSVILCRKTVTQGRLELRRARGPTLVCNLFGVRAASWEQSTCSD
jgi:hypothetical protein